VMAEWKPAAASQFQSSSDRRKADPCLPADASDGPLVHYHRDRPMSSFEGVYDAAITSISIISFELKLLPLILAAVVFFR